MKIKKYIEKGKLLIDVDGKSSWKRDLKSGETTILSQEYFQMYRENWSKADYSETPDLVLVSSFIKMKNKSEINFQGFIIDGSRPNHIFDNDIAKTQSNWIGDVRLQDGLELRPGDQAEAIVRFLLKTPVEDFLHEGRIWWLRAGNNIIAECEMKEIKTTHTIV